MKRAKACANNWRLILYVTKAVSVAIYNRHCNSNEEKREQELRSLMNISNNFQKFVITEDPIKRYQDENGVVFMNIYEFLLDKESLKV